MKVNNYAHTSKPPSRLRSTEEGQGMQCRVAIATKTETLIIVAGVFQGSSLE